MKHLLFYCNECMQDDISGNYTKVHRSGGYACDMCGLETDSGYLRSTRVVHCYQPPPRNGHVYLYACYSNKRYVKIGRATNIEARKKQLGFPVEVPFKTELLYACAVDDCIEEEKRLHCKYKDKRMEGEWFDLSDDDIEDIKTHLEDAV